MLLDFWVLACFGVGCAAESVGGLGVGCGLLGAPQSSQGHVLECIMIFCNCIGSRFDASRILLGAVLQSFLDVFEVCYGTQFITRFLIFIWLGLWRWLVDVSARLDMSEALNTLGCSQSFL